MGHRGIPGVDRSALGRMASPTCTGGASPLGSCTAIPCPICETPARVHERWPRDVWLVIDGCRCNGYRIRANLLAARRLKHLVPAERWGLQGRIHAKHASDRRAWVDTETGTVRGPLEVLAVPRAIPPKARSSPSQALSGAEGLRDKFGRTLTCDPRRLDDVRGHCKRGNRPLIGARRAVVIDIVVRGHRQRVVSAIDIPAARWVSLLPPVRP